MPSKEQKLQVALGHLMDPLPYQESNELPDFIGNMPPEGVDWWLNWAQDAIIRKRDQAALAYRLQQKKGFGGFTPHAIHRMLNQFPNAGIDAWLNDIQVDSYPLAVINHDVPFSPEVPREPAEIFRDLYREIIWTHQTVSPALYTMPGTEKMAKNLAAVAGGAHQFDEVGIHKGRLFVPRNGTYVPEQADLFCQFDYERVSAGIILTDFHDDFAVLAFHSQPRVTDRLPARTQFSLITMQDSEMLNLQQLRMQFYDESNRPCASESAHIIIGDITTLESGDLVVEESFVLRQNQDRMSFYRDLHK